MCREVALLQHPVSIRHVTSRQQLPVCELHFRSTLSAICGSQGADAAAAKCNALSDSHVAAGEQVPVPRVALSQHPVSIWHDDVICCQQLCR